MKKQWTKTYQFHLFSVHSDFLIPEPSMCLLKFLSLTFDLTYQTESEIVLYINPYRLKIIIPDIPIFLVMLKEPLSHLIAFNAKGTISY